MKQTLVIVCCCLLLSVWAVQSAADERLTKPTDDQKKQIQEAMNQSNGPAANGDFCREQERLWRSVWFSNRADYWADRAEYFESIETAIRNNVIDMVDDYYDIEAPPNTTISYDPNSTDYGYTYGTKTDIEVVLCPDAFDDGPGLVASTKIHELRHAWQIYWCWSDYPGFWKDCEWWYHFTEWDAYDEEERAYDSCFTSDMPSTEKDLIRERMREHLKAMADIHYAGWLETLLRSLADAILDMFFTVYNPNSLPDTVTVEITDELGWTITPSFFSIPLDPEGAQMTPSSITIPPGTPPGTVNAVTLTSTSTFDPSNPVTDKLYVVVMPTVDVVAGGGVAGLPGDTVGVQYDVVNNGPVADTFDCQLTSTLGWTVTPSSLSLPLLPGQSGLALATVDVPPGAEDWATDLIFCTATSTTDPTQTDRGWLSVEVMEYDAAALGVEEPFGSYEQNAMVSSRIWVTNSGHIDSFFDVSFVIERMDGTTFWEELVSVPALPPGESMDLILSPVELLESGDFTAIATVLLADDANPDNDVAMGSFTVTSTGTIDCSITSVPPSGIVPFSTQFSVSLINTYTGQTRRIAGRINVLIANGQSFSNWKSGWTNVAAGSSYDTSWSQNIPALGSVIGDNVFTLEAQDVTPAPYNQPPEPPSGDTCGEEHHVIAFEP